MLGRKPLETADAEQRHGPVHTACQDVERGSDARLAAGHTTGGGAAASLNDLGAMQSGG